MKVIFGTWNRVSRTCSKNPKINGMTGGGERVAEVAFNLGETSTGGQFRSVAGRGFAARDSSGGNHQSCVQFPARPPNPAKPCVPIGPIPVPPTP